MRWIVLIIAGIIFVFLGVMSVSAVWQHEKVIQITVPLHQLGEELTFPIKTPLTENIISSSKLLEYQPYKERITFSFPVQVKNTSNNEEIQSELFTASPVRTYWIDPVKGNDRNAGTNRTSPLRTLTSAWNKIPKKKVLTVGYNIMLLPGDYRQEHIPGWMSGAFGSSAAIIKIQAVNGAHTSKIHTPIEINNCRYISLINLDIITEPGSYGGGNVLHISSSNHIQLKGCTLNGKAGGVRLAQETLKANQVRFLDVDGCDISGAFWYPLDYVAVQDGKITRSKIHDAGEFCMVIKGGSSRIQVERNQIYDGNTGAISAGSGTGFNWMVSPYLHYEIYDSKFVNNIIQKAGVVGISVNGGYNILIAHNTIYKAGTRDHILEVMLGSRSCDGDATTCEKYRLAGGWGTKGEGQYIPSAHVYIFNNIFYNPTGYQSQWNQFVIQGPVKTPSGSHVPSPSYADKDLQIKGNLIWNGPPVSPNLPLFGEDGGCKASNPTCNSNVIIASNKINKIEPQFTSPGSGNFTPKKYGNIYTVKSAVIPSFTGNDRPKPPLAPGGVLSNVVPIDYYQKKRSASSPPGAII